MFSEIVPLAVAIAASPFPIIPAILLLFTPRARATSLGFISGWIVGIVVVTSVFIALAAVIRVDDEPAQWASWSRIALGTALLVLGGYEWLIRNTKTDVPAWMQSIDGLTPLKAARLAFLLSAANPKILFLCAAAGVSIGSSGSQGAEALAALALFTLIASSTVMLPLIVYAIRGDRMLVPLGKVRDWLQRNNAAVMAVVITIIGAVLITKGVQGL